MYMCGNIAQEPLQINKIIPNLIISTLFLRRSADAKDDQGGQVRELGRIGGVHCFEDPYI